MAKQNFSCRRAIFEPLETRTLLSSGQSQVSPSRDYTEFLSVHNVRQILDQAASEAEPGQVIVVADRDGHILGVFDRSGVLRLSSAKRNALITSAASSAITAGFFESTQEAFSTRTARFIIQDHFPFPVGDTPGGPLYGVEFSSLPGSDVFSGAGISGNPGGIPLYKNGVPVGGIGVFGAGPQIAPRKDLAGRHQAYYTGAEEPEVNEAVALAGAFGFMAPKSVQASQIFLSGLRLPFTVNSAAMGQPLLPLTELGVLADAPSLGLDSPELVTGYTPYPSVTIDGVPGQLKNTNPDALALPTTPPTRYPFDQKYGVVASPQLSAQAVVSIISNAVKQATELRSAIREPIGVSARVHISVVGLNGQILGVFRMQDATNFSYDVAVQKARTALFFSDDGHAFSTTAVGFLAQAFFPPGINRNPSTTGPLYHIQNDLSANLENGVDVKAPLLNGITIFPGGIPLYQNGKLVGAIGVSGDGVEQDDMIAYAGTAGYRPPQRIRSDELGSTSIANFIAGKLNQLQTQFGVDPTLIAQDEKVNSPGLYSDVNLPFVKFPRDPYL